MGIFEDLGRAFGASRGRDDPVAKLTRLNEGDLKALQAQLDTEIPEFSVEIKSKKRRRDELEIKLKATTDRNDHAIIESDLKEAKQDIELLGRDQDARVKTREVTRFLLKVRKGRGTQITDLDKKLASIMNMKPDQIQTALDKLSVQSGMALDKVSNIGQSIDDYASPADQTVATPEVGDIRQDEERTETDTADNVELEEGPKKKREVSLEE
ncbi:MAG: hypothetical protein HY556_04850 [Euryarchaeota archaeon]|nr:hypothetical protein [Euryarchaeota archaeon]